MPTKGKDYDVFLSHNSTDKLAVESLARRLEDEAHLTPFLDKWHLVPGNPWQEELERALDRSDTCAVFIGPRGIGPWHNEELRSALDERVGHSGFRVVPVLLPGATLPERGQLPRFLRRLTWVDFRCSQGLDDAAVFYRLVAGIRGVAPGRDGEGVTILPMMECPYRGLEVFGEVHAQFFFGREADTQHLVEALRTTRFLAVVGPSGSGKSSLVRAGLLPQLRAGALPGSQWWQYCIFKPGAHPLEELAVSLAQITQRTDVQGLLKSLEADERELHLQIRLLLKGQSEELCICLVIDQFEELFTLCQDQKERQHFVNTLRYAATVLGGQTVVVPTMRADFIARAADYPPLAELVSDHQFLVSLMEREDLRRAIEKPAQLVGVQLEDGLAERLLQDTGQEPGALPLLEHALLQLWQKPRVDNIMTFAAYTDIGGAQGALAKQADEVFAGFSPEQQRIARLVLLRLTQPGEGTEDTRRRAVLSELYTRVDEKETVEQVVKTLADARLLVTNEDQQVDVAHEALIRSWPRLRQWIEEDRSALRTHLRIAEATRDWQTNGEDESYLYQGTRLLVGEEWAQSHGELLSIVERRFLETSIALRDRKWHEEEARRERELENAKKAAELDRLRAEEAEKRAEEESKRAAESEERRERLKRTFEKERVAHTPQLYDAFLCYSHARDARLASALQAALHRFAKPWYKLRAMRVFRDATSLDVSPGFWASIAEALRQSAYLILLASPEAARSLWVQREVEFWLETKSPDKILIILTEGDIVWDAAIDDFDWERTTALSKNLRHVFPDEPLYLDLRWAISEYTLSLRNPLFLDVVASLAAPIRQISRSELVGEENRQHRRLRRVAAMVALTIFILASVAIFSTYQLYKATHNSVGQPLNSGPSKQ
jgi:hypothetical protein